MVSNLMSGNIFKRKYSRSKMIRFYWIIINKLFVGEFGAAEINI